MGRALESTLACPLPIGDGLLCEPSLGVVMCQQFRLTFSRLEKLCFQDVGDALMVLLPRALEQGLIGGVLY
jgi:hypothetical protein